jgi:hypothetical protein
MKAHMSRQNAGVLTHLHSKVDVCVSVSSDSQLLCQTMTRPGAGPQSRPATRTWSHFRLAPAASVPNYTANIQHVRLMKCSENDTGNAHQSRATILAINNGMTNIYTTLKSNESQKMDCATDRTTFAPISEF